MLWETCKVCKRSIVRRLGRVSLSHTSGTSSADPTPLILGEASATLLQSTNEKLDTALTLEVIRTSQLVEIVGEFLCSLTEVERFESLLVVCFRGLNWWRCFLGRRRTDAFPGPYGRLGCNLGGSSGFRA